MGMLTAQDEVELAKRIREGDQEALQKLVKANLRFVISVAKQYHHTKMPLNDLINEGNVGLIKAAKMFDETKGFKFISYAVWWIRQSIIQALAEHSRIVRIPANKIGNLTKITNAVSVMEQQFEREPTHEELADFLGVKPEDIRNSSNAAIRQSSLDASFEEGEDGSLYDVIADPEAKEVESEIEFKGSLRTEIERLLATLTPREREVIKRSFGIGTEFGQSLEDIAEGMALTRERVRQIKETGLKKLRTKAGFKLLVPYLAN